MARRRGSPRSIKFTLRFYPGQDDDLSRWLDALDGEQIGATSRAMKEALRDGTDAGQVEAVRGIGTEPALDLVEERQVVETAVASALGRFWGEISSATVLGALE